MDISLKTNIAQLKTAGIISTRVYNVCLNADMRTVEEILKRQPHDLKTLPKCGTKVLEELKKLQNDCRRLLESPLSIESGEQMPCMLETLAKSVNQKYRYPDFMHENKSQYTLAEAVRLLLISVHLRKTYRTDLQMLLGTSDTAINLLRSNPRKLVDLIAERWRPEDCQRVFDALKELAARLSKAPGIALETRRRMSETCSMFERIVPPWIDAALPEVDDLDERDRFMLGCYMKHLMGVMSVRARNCISQYDTPAKLFRLKEPVSGQMVKDIKNCGRKTREEIDRMLVSLEVYFEALKNGSKGDESARIKADCIFNANDWLKETLPFLEEDERRQIAPYVDKGRRLPYEYIFYRYIMTSDGSDARVYRDFYDMGRNGHYATTEELSKAIGISKERVRQLRQTSVSMPADMDKYLQQAFDAFSGDYISPYDVRWQRIARFDMKGLNIYQMMGLLTAVNDRYVLVSFQELEEPYLLSRSLVNSLRLRSCMTSLMSKVNRHYSQPLQLRLKEEIRQYMYDASDDDKAGRLAMFMADCIGSVCSVTDSDNECNITIAPNKLDRCEALENIVRDAGMPMSVDELWEAYRQKYPDTPLRNVQSLRSYLLKSTKLVALGKTSKYALQEWENIYTGTLSDYLYMKISEADEPLTLDTIVELARSVFPKTTEKSVYSLLIMDPGRRYVVYEGQRFGLAEKSHDNYSVKPRKVVKRQGADLRLAAIENMLNNERRMPLDWDKAEEVSLIQWIYNVKHDIVPVENDVKRRLDELLTRYSHYPQTKREYAFREMCDKVRGIVETTQRLPHYKLHPKEAGWWTKNIKCYKEYGDNRKRYFEELLDFLREMGFVI